MNTLKELREAKGLYQKDVANAIGVDRTTYVKYEKGSSEPNFQTLEALANFFCVSVDYLLGREKTEKPATKNDDELSQIDAIFSSLTPDNRSKLLELAHLYLDNQRKTEEKK